MAGNVEAAALLELWDSGTDLTDTAEWEIELDEPAPAQLTAPRTIDLSDRPKVIQRPERPEAQGVSGKTEAPLEQDQAAEILTPWPVAARPEQPVPGHYPIQPVLQSGPRLAEPTLAAVLAGIGSLAAWTTMAPASVWLPLAVLPAAGLFALLLPGADVARLIRAAMMLAAGAVLPTISSAMTPVTLLIALGAAATYPLLVETRAAKAVTAAAVSALLTPLVVEAYRAGPHAFLASLMDPASGTQTAVRIALTSGIVVTGLIGTSAMASRRMFTASARAAAGRERSANQRAEDASETASRLGIEATHDHGTGLPNRQALIRRVASILDRQPASAASGEDAREPAGDPLLAAVEIDRFEAIADSLGADSADEVAAAAGRRLRASLPGQYLVARLSRHQFAVLMVDASHDAGAELGRRVSHCMDHPITAHGRDIQVTCSIGMVLGDPATGLDSAGDALQAADEAVRAARRNGRPWVMFDQAVRAQAQTQASLEIELREAVRSGRIDACYQPVLALGTGGDDDRIVGAEALARWTRADGSTVPAQHLMSMADDLGLGDQLGMQLIEQALDALLEWREEGVGVDQVWVNLVPGQLRNPDLAHEISARLAVRGLNSSCLVLEVSADGLIETELALSSLSMLRSLGVAIALDDFGRTGTSLTALRALPISAIKVDQQLASELGRHDDVPRSIVQLCHSLGLRVVAQGVETMIQLHGAREIEADAVQGHAIARPMSAQDVTNLLSLRLPREFRLK